jgi:hypothetical protein
MVTDRRELTPSSRGAVIRARVVEPAVAGHREQLGSLPVLGGVEVCVGPERHVWAGMPSPTRGRPPVHALGDQMRHHQVPEVVQPAPDAHWSGQLDEPVGHVRRVDRP